MATPAQQLPRFLLPSRVHAGGSASQGLPARLALAGRIAELPGAEAVECGGDTLPQQVAVYLHRVTARCMLRHPRLRPLCRLSADGVVIHGLDNRAKRQVIIGGWGTLLHGRVLLYLPRDDEELETCWSIIRQAYDALLDSAVFSAGNGNGSGPHMPKFSRTTLQ